MKTKNCPCWCATVLALGLVTGGCGVQQPRSEGEGDGAVSETERLVVCEISGDPHLLKDDVILLTRLGSSANIRMEVIRYEGTPNEMHPWKSGGGNDNTIIVNPSITGKDHSNPAFKKFTPEAVGLARINPHTGGTPEDHAFSMRRNTRVNFPNDCNTPPGEEDMMIFVPPHETGGRHGGHAVAD